MLHPYLSKIESVLDDQRFATLFNQFDKSSFIFNSVDNIETRLVKMLIIEAIRDPKRDFPISFLKNKDKINLSDVKRIIPFSESFLKNNKLRDDIFDKTALRDIDYIYQSHHNSQEQDFLKVYRDNSSKILPTEDDIKALYHKFVVKEPSFDELKQFQIDLKLKAGHSKENLDSVPVIVVDEVDMDSLNDHERKAFKTIRDSKLRIIENGTISTTFIITLIKVIRVHFRVQICKIVSNTENIIKKRKSSIGY